MTNPRTKGAGGEREIIKLFVQRMELIEVKLNICGHSANVKRCSSVQADGGGSDIVGIPGLSIEVKRQEILSVDKWWQQCCEQAPTGTMPILFYRQSRMTWRVRMYMMTHTPAHWYPAEISAKDFMNWFEQWYSKLLLQNVTT